MAFTETQRASIRMYLGFQSRYYSTDTILEHSMDAIGATAEAQARAEGELTALADIDSRLSGSYGRLKAEQLEDGVRLPGAMEIGMLRSEGRRHVGRLSVIFGVSPKHDVFSGSAPAHIGIAYGPYDPTRQGGGGNYGQEG